VRNKIKMFATQKVTLPPGYHKVVILDEADSMTKGAQQALRRTMELHSATTRFALACNNSTKIIEPIQSRCAILRYSKLSDEQVLKRLREVRARGRAGARAPPGRACQGCRHLPSQSGSGALGGRRRHRCRQPIPPILSPLRRSQVCTPEAIPWELSGMEALVFTAEGDMRNALNNLQSTFAGFGACSARARAEGGLRRAAALLGVTACLLGLLSR